MQSPKSDFTQSPKSDFTPWTLTLPPRKTCRRLKLMVPNQKVSNTYLFRCTKINSCQNKALSYLSLTNHGPQQTPASNKQTNHETFTCKK